MKPPAYIPRHIEAYVKRNASMYPCVSICGPRQSGKTTMARHVFAGYDYVNMESPNDREFFEKEPLKFLEAHPAPVIFDEVQNTPKLLSYLMVIVDEANPPGTHRPGMYILTGSHQPALRAALAQTLAGRVGIVTLLPLSMEEMAEAGLRTTRNEALFRGCLPRVASGIVTPLDAYGDYTATYVERDVRRISNVRNLLAFETFLRVLASQVGGPLNLCKLAKEVGVSAPAIREWVSILEASYIIRLLPPYYKNFGKRVTKTPKVYFTEPGLVAYLLNIGSTEELEGHPLLGPIFENMVVMEACKARLNAGKLPNLYFFRDAHGFEVDLVLDLSRNPRPIEIKSSEEMTDSLMSKLRNVRKFVTDFSPGAIPGVIYGGESLGMVDGLEIRSFHDAGKLVVNPLANNAP